MNAGADEKSRANYIDALKTLAAASGISMAVVSVGIQHVEPESKWIVQRAVVCLTLCAVSSLTTLFWLSLAYDWARTQPTPSNAPSGTVGVPVPLKGLIWIFLLTYIALLTFFLGLAYTARITYHISLPSPTAPAQSTHPCGCASDAKQSGSQSGGIGAICIRRAKQRKTTKSLSEEAQEDKTSDCKLAPSAFPNSHVPADRCRGRSRWAGQLLHVSMPDVLCTNGPILRQERRDGSCDARSAPGCGICPYMKLIDPRTAKPPPMASLESCLFFRMADRRRRSLELAPGAGEECVREFGSQSVDALK